MIKDDSTEKEIFKKKLQLEGLYLKKMRNELKETHSIKSAKKEIARLYTKLNVRGDM